MKKKLSASFPPEKPVRVRAERIFAKPLNNREKMQLRQLESVSDREIDYSDVPELSDEQLAAMVPRDGKQKTTMVSIRLKSDVLAWLKAKGPGHLSRINTILTNVMEAEQRLMRTKET